jgi:HSP20 family protein
MGSVNLKPGQSKQNQASSGKPVHYYVSGIVNWHMSPRPNVWRPPTDVYETEEKIIVRVEIAGMHGEQISVSFENGILSISGSRYEAPEKRAFHQMEIYFGEFFTEIEIPVVIDIENIDANYQDGFLRVNLPKASPKQIKIKPD